MVLCVIHICIQGSHVCRLSLKSLLKRFLDPKYLGTGALWKACSPVGSSEEAVKFEKASPKSEC